MRQAALAFAAASTLASLAPPAFAQATAADTADVRCLMVLQAIGNDPKQRDAAARGVYYYIGKLSARGPIARVEPMMVTEGKKMNAGPIIQGELSRCGGELSQRTSELQGVNQRLQKALGLPAAAPAAKAAPPAKK